jgi:hypothetical protein
MCLELQSARALMASVNTRSVRERAFRIAYELETLGCFPYAHEWEFSVAAA